MTTTAPSSTSPDLQLSLEQNLFIRQAVPSKGIVCSNAERARRLAQECLVDTHTFSCSWGSQVWVGHYREDDTQQEVFVALAPVGSGSGLVFQELFAAGCRYLVRYGSDDVKNPDPQEHELVKLIDVTDNLYGFCQASGLPPSEWGARVPASPVLLEAFAQEAREQDLVVQRRICHHLENYHSLRQPSTYPNRQAVLQQQLKSLRQQAQGQPESFDMESAVLFRVAQDAQRHAISVLQTVNKEQVDCDPYEGDNRVQALAMERQRFSNYIWKALLRVQDDQPQSNTKAIVEAREQKEKEALVSVEHAIRTHGKNHFKTFQARFGYAKVLLANEKYPQAELVLRESLELQLQQLNVTTRNVTEPSAFMEVHVGTMFMLGNSLWRQRNSADNTATTKDGTSKSLELIQEAIFWVECAVKKARASLGHQHALSKTIQSVWNSVFSQQPSSHIQLPTRQCFEIARVTGGYCNFVTWQTAANQGAPTTLFQQLDLAMCLANCALGPTKTVQQHEATDDEKTPSLWRQTDLEPRDYFQALQTPKPGMGEGQELETKSLVTWKGIRVGWFLNVFCKSPFIQLHCQYGCQLWFFRKVCVIESIRQAWLVTTGAVNAEESKQQLATLTGPFVDHMDKVIQAWELSPRGSENTEIVANATTFLSYTGAYTLEHVIQVLGQLNPKEYLWMDVFCVNQFAWTGMGRTHSMKSF